MLPFLFTKGMNTYKPFKGLNVIELASVLAGPSVGMFFAELGATVTKIENPKTNGDITRGWKLKNEKKHESSAYYQSINWGKKVKLWDLNSAGDLEKLYTLVKKSDIVIANYKKNDDQKLGVDYKTLKKINPGLIYGKIEGFNDSKRVAFDLVLQAETGFMSMTGTPNSGPVKMPVALIDILAGHQLKEGILCALIKRNKTGLGCLIKVSLFDSAICSLINQASNFLINKEIPKPMGSLHPNIAPYGEIFTTADRIQFTLAIGTEKQFDDLLDILALSKHKKLLNNQLRVKNRNLLKKNLEQKINKLYSKTLFKNLLLKNIPFGEIKNLKEVISDLDSTYFLHYKNQNKIIKTVAFKPVNK
jgi:crotonobetainyl-CoA:carnitine CoA-transferase CaiB-like acyl-CoA transferase